MSLIHWRRRNTETVNAKEYISEVYGTYNCPPPDLNDFIPYQDLTKQEVDSWLDDGLDVISLDLNLDNQIEQLVNPPLVQLPLPFSN